jgi:ABC-type nitrate/sulfonate/bicarbonate transport system substrate-binding protein
MEGNATEEDLRMNSYDCMKMFLPTRHHRQRLRDFLAAVLTIELVGFAPSAFAQPIKIAYAALVAGQIPVWSAKEGGYLSNHGIDADLIYIPATAATQALIANEIQLAQVTGVSTAGAILSARN